MKIVIAGEIHSTNLGDRLIHDCLRYLFIRSQPKLTVTALDISGRNSAGAPHLEPRDRLRWIRWAESHIPLVFSLLNAIVQARLAQKRNRQAWHPALQDASALVIGGGQLLQDNQLGFPVKLFMLAREARRRGIPVMICACGVGAGWSPIARRLFADVLESARSITVRDPLSQSRLKHFLPQVVSRVTFDPAIWAQAVYGAKPPFAQAKIGLGVISHLDVNLHLPRRKHFTEEKWLKAWSDILFVMHQQGQKLELFSNGSALDQQFAQKLAGRTKEIYQIAIPVADRPTNVPALVQNLAGFRAVAACRLHASILADAYQIPSVGMVWDEKVRAYYGMRGFPERALELIPDPPRLLSAVIREAVEVGIDDQRWNEAKASAQSAVEIVLSALR